MIKECKDILQTALQEHFPYVVVVRSAKDETHQIGVRKFPLVALITNPGSFAHQEGKLVRYSTGEALEEREVKGRRTVPIIVRVWGEGEEAVDALFSRLLPLIPRRFMLDGFEGTISILSEEHSDHAGNLSKLYASVVETAFAVDIASDPVAVPVIKHIETEIEGIRF
jgi:hypothetical protein